MRALMPLSKSISNYSVRNKHIMQNPRECDLAARGRSSQKIQLMQISDCIFKGVRGHAPGNLGLQKHHFQRFE